MLVVLAIIVGFMGICVPIYMYMEMGVGIDNFVDVLLLLIWVFGCVFVGNLLLQWDDYKNK